MTSDHGRHLTAWQARAVAAETRAAAEARRASRSEEVAAQGPESLRDLHRHLAEVHRHNEERHRQTALLHRSLVNQLKAYRIQVSVGPLLANAVAAATRCPSSAIVLLAGDGSVADFIATDGLAEAAQDLELVHDEGPLHAACASGRSCALTEGDLRTTWPDYGSDLAALGIRSVVAAPLRAGSSVIGAVGLFNPPSTALDGPVLEGLASGVTPILLDEARDAGVGDVDLAFDGMRDIHQAAGVVAAEAGCDVRAAMALIRARAFVSDEPATATARRILAGELHLSL